MLGKVAAYIFGGYKSIKKSLHSTGILSVLIVYPPMNFYTLIPHHHHANF